MKTHFGYYGVPAILSAKQAWRILTEHGFPRSTIEGDATVDPLAKRLLHMLDHNVVSRKLLEEYLGY